MYPAYCLCLYVAYFSVTHAFQPWATWPHPESLVGFWPFDTENQLSDIANNYGLTKIDAKLMSIIKGPFGQTDTAFSVTTDGGRVGFRSGIPITAAFTLSFYFYTHARDIGGMFMFSNNDVRFVLNYVEPNFLEVWAGQKYSKITGQFPVLMPKTWNFVTITCDQGTLIVSIYNQASNTVAFLFNVNMLKSPMLTTVNVGHTDWEFGSANMKTSDAISCLMIYNRTLTSSEIADLQYQCQTKGQTTKSPATTTTIELPAIKPWPKPEFLVGFWPLGFRYTFHDVSSNRFDGSASNWKNEFTIGPFGDKDTAMKIQFNDTYLFVAQDKKLAQSGSFTISLFFTKAGYSTAGGLFEFFGDGCSAPSHTFQFRYENETTIQVSANNNTIGHYTMIQQKGVWTYVAFVFDGSNGMFSVYSRHGLVSRSYQPNIWSSAIFSTEGIRLGHASRWRQGLREGDALSCLMIFSAALTGAEVRQARDSCRVIHDTPQCGSPKTLLPSIPAITLITTVPKSDQFPYIAVIRFGSDGICSGSVVDPYWILSSAACFPDNRNISAYRIYVGEYDLSVDEGHTKEHSIAKVFVSGNSGRDVALIEVTEPIDFTSDYVNDVCLYRPENADELELSEAQFMNGWGKNGRHGVTSTTLPRYVIGLTMYDEECALSWGNFEFDSSRDYCFISSSKDKDVPCVGDEGSPLLAQLHADPTRGWSDRLLQIGIYYKREPNCQPCKPILITNIQAFSNWIFERLACTVPGAYYPDKCPQDYD